jgi:AraC-like DNA-binding protein
MSGTLGGVRQAARPKAAAAGNEDDLLLGINLSGRSIARQDDRELRLEAGDAILATRGTEGFSIIRPQPVRFIGLRVPRNALAPLVGRLDEAPIEIVPRGTEALDLLVAYAGALAAGEVPQTPELRRLVASHVQDLIATAVAAIRDTRAIVGGRAIAAARVRMIMADIAAHLGDCDLTAAAVAQRQRMTPRYVHKLFEREGLVFSQFVLGRRLAQAHRMLSDLRLASRSISSVAFEVGFGDLSYFNRAFAAATAPHPRKSSDRPNETIDLANSERATATAATLRRRPKPSALHKPVSPG